MLLEVLKLYFIYMLVQKHLTLFEFEWIWKAYPATDSAKLTL